MPEADAAGGLGGDQRGARAHERVVDRLTRARVVEDRAAHAFHRLLRAVDGGGVLVAAGDGPERRLLAVAVPVALAGLPDRIPARLVLPVVVAAAEHQPLLRPDDLGADGEAGSLEALGDGRGVQCAVPDVGDVAGEERPGFPPVGAVVVQHLAGAAGGGGAGLVAPGGVVVDAVRRVADHQVRLHAGQQARDVVRHRGVAAEQPVVPEYPEIAGAADGDPPASPGRRPRPRGRPWRPGRGAAGRARHRRSRSAPGRSRRAAGRRARARGAARPTRRSRLARLSISR